MVKLRISETLGSKEWRLEHLYKIKNVESEVVDFVMNGSQREYFENRGLKNIVLKARQLGISTFECIDALDDAFWNKNFVSVIIADRKENTGRLFEKIKFALENMPKELYKANVRSITAECVEFLNGSSIYVSLSTRSRTVNRLHVSELARMCTDFPLRAEEVITGAFEAVPPKGRISVESTARGYGGHFFNLWYESPQNGFKKFFFPWFNEKRYRTVKAYVLPEKFLRIQEAYHLETEQINWYYEKWLVLKDLLPQENPGSPEEAFLQGGRPVFDSEFICRCVAEPPKSGHWYIAGLDTALGTGGDWSVLTIVDVNTGRQVFTLRSQEPIREFASKAVGMCYKYNEALLNIEINGIGQSMLSQVVDTHEYKNLFHEKKGYDQVSKTMTKRVGTVTSRSNKTNMIAMVKEMFEQGELFVSDETTFLELVAYQWDNNDKMSAPAGLNDDTVMALALAIRGWSDVKVRVERFYLDQQKRKKREWGQDVKKNRPVYSSMIGV